MCRTNNQADRAQQLFALLSRQATMRQKPGAPPDNSGTISLHMLQQSGGLEENWHIECRVLAGAISCAGHIAAISVGRILAEFCITHFAALPSALPRMKLQPQWLRGFQIAKQPEAHLPCDCWATSPGATSALKPRHLKSR